MKVYIQGKGEVNLTDRDFIGEGGEGKIYGKGKIIFKVYEEPSKMIPIGKIQELSVLDSKNIIIPREILLDKQKAVIGFTMDFVPNSIPLCKFFTNSFRDANNIDTAMTKTLVEKMQEVIEFIHNKGCIQVDGNEMNYLVSGDTLVDPFFIDINSYQTPSFPATAIMPSIRDWTSSSFSQLTDWYSFAIVSCQLFIGIHPFKGGHPKFKPGQMVDRMKANISIFNPKSTVPPSTRDFSNIPSDYMNWYLKVFEKGERLAPPVKAGSLVIVPMKFKVIKGTHRFVVDLIREYSDEIVSVKSIRNQIFVKTKKEIWEGNICHRVSKKVNVASIPPSLDYVFVKSENNFLKLYDPFKSEDIDFTLNSQETFTIENSIFSRNNGTITEILISDFNGKKVPYINSKWEVMPLSSQVFDGVIYQNILGKSFINIPIPVPGKGCMIYEKRIPELDGYKVIDGKYDNGVCIFTIHKKSTYSRMILRFSKERKKYDYRIIHDISISDINFITLDNGLCIFINEDGAVELFKNEPSTKIEKIEDPDIDTTMKLCKSGQKVMFFRDNSLFSITMK